MTRTYLGQGEYGERGGYGGRARGLAAAPPIGPRMGPGYDGRFAYPPSPSYGSYGGRADALRAEHPWAASQMGPGYGGGVAYGTYVGHWQELAPSPMCTPGAMLIDAPPPTRANRDILPMSTGVPILPTQSAQITGRPQTVVFQVNRFLISNAGTAGGAADWIVNDIKIGNRSQFVQSGDVPGDLFATNAIDTFVRFDTAQTAMDVVVVVTYIGLNECGAPFFGAMVGTAAV